MREESGSDWSDCSREQGQYAIHQHHHHHHTWNDRGSRAEPRHAHGSPEHEKAAGRQRARKSEESGIARIFRTLRRDEGRGRKAGRQKVPENCRRRGSLDRSPGWGRERSPDRRRAKSVDRRPEKARRGGSFLSEVLTSRRSRQEDSPLKDASLLPPFHRDPGFHREANQEEEEDTPPPNKGQLFHRAFKKKGHLLRDGSPERGDRENRFTRDRSPERFYKSQVGPQQASPHRNNADEVTAPRLTEYYSTLKSSSGRCPNKQPQPKKRPYESHKDLSV